jgi:4-hydroxy-3-methylbut-2-enyl diphosphate reductase
MTVKTILLIHPRGFCAGVERAIEIVERAIEKYGPPIYVKHEIVHNKNVVRQLRAKGAIFVEELDEIPQGAIVIFSAHGVSDIVEKAAITSDLRPIDATCPLVKKVHNQAKYYENNDREVILIGHAGHPEVEGTLGRVKKPMHLVQNIQDVASLAIETHIPVAYITQTTLSVDDTAEIISALKEKFTNIAGPAKSDICYATQNRQTAVKKACKMIDVILVIGSINSSNSNRLKDIALDHGVAAYLIDTYTDIKSEWLENIERVGITAGASAPEYLIEDVMKHLQSLFPGANIINSDFGIVENIQFRIPKKLS